MSENHTLAPLASGDTAAYRIEAEAQLQHLLLRLGRRPELVCLYPQGKREPFALSALLQVNDDQLIFDVSPDEEINRALENTPVLVCVSQLDRVHLQFDAPAPRRIQHQGRPALRTERPKSILHIQRRDYFRLSIPPREPVICHIPTQAGDHLTVEIIDISAGGLSLPGPLPGLGELATGTRLSDCHLQLPETGIIHADLQVCSFRENRHTQGTRIGCRFVQLSAGEQTLIQRYIHRIERHRIAQE